MSGMRRFNPLFFFILVGLLTFWKPLFHPDFTLLSGGDICAQTYPWFNVAAHWLKKGVFLLWDPYVYAGKANLGELQPGVLYPVNWLFMLLPEKDGGVLSGGLECLIVLNYVLAGFFCFLLGRSFGLKTWGALLAGVAFAIGGYTVQLYAWVNIFSGFIWMPLVFLLFRKALLATDRIASRRLVLWSAVALAASFLAGHHAPPVHISLLLFLYTVFRCVRMWTNTDLRTKFSWVAMLVGLGLTAGLLTAVQSLPSSEWARFVWRWVGEGDPVKWGETISYTVLQRTGNLNPQDAASFVLPYMAIGANVYVGAVILFFAAIGVLFARGEGAGFFRLGAPLYFFLSWGQFSALHGWLNTFVPGVWFAREVYLYLVPFQLCLALLAGFGLDHLIKEYSSGVERAFGVFIRRAGWTMAILVLVTSVLLVAANIFVGLAWDNAFVKRGFVLAAYVTVLGILLFFLHTRRIGAPLFGFLALTVVIVDLTSQFSMSIRSSRATRDQSNPAAGAYWKIPPEAEFLKDLRKNEVFRVDDPAQVFPPNFGDAWLLEETMGHGATARVDYLDFRGIGWGPASNPSALLNVRYFVSRIPVPGMPKVFESASAVYRNPRAVPRAFVASRYRGMENDKDILAWIQSPFFSPSGTVILKSKDLAQLPPRFLEMTRNEDEGLRVRILSFSTAAEKEAEKSGDEEVRHRLNVYHAPWGWSTGDEIAWEVRPERPIEHCFLVFDYFPAGTQASRLELKLNGAGRELTIPVTLAGLSPGEAETGALQESAVDLGPLSAEEFKLSLVRMETCVALIDSLRVSLSAPIPGDLHAGNAALTLFKPNRLRVEVDLKRPSFVVVSELYYPGWEASVDGKPAALIEGDYILRAIPVDAGRHEIMLRFRSKSFQWGLFVSLATLVGVALLMIFRF